MEHKHYFAVAYLGHPVTSQSAGILILRYASAEILVAEPRPTGLVSGSCLYLATFTKIPAVP